jgi:hypothetical protein
LASAGHQMASADALTVFVFVTMIVLMMMFFAIALPRQLIIA